MSRTATSANNSVAMTNIRGIESFIADIQNVSSFMLMTINRSLDYAKVSVSVFCC